MKRIAALTLVAIMSLSIPVFGHGNMEHILGTVTKIAGNTVTVEKDGKSTEVVLAPSTTYEVNGKAGTQADIKVGDRVVIHAMKMSGKETAHEVRIAHPTK